LKFIDFSTSINAVLYRMACTPHHDPIAGRVALWRMLRRLVLWQRQWVTRRALADLEAHRLKDIGLTEVERRTECAKFFWK
jgi:uncharacterized protein YjiS (DUF1127 family)